MPLDRSAARDAGLNIIHTAAPAVEALPYVGLVFILIDNIVALVQDHQANEAAVAVDIPKELKDVKVRPPPHHFFQICFHSSTKT